MSSAVILTWMEIRFVFITAVLFCFGSFRTVTLSIAKGVKIEWACGEWLGISECVKSQRHLGPAGTEKSCLEYASGMRRSMRCFVYIFGLFCLICLGAFKKRHLGVSLCLGHVPNMRSPTHNGLKCK